MTASVATQALTTKARVHDVLVEEHTLVQDDSILDGWSERIGSDDYRCYYHDVNG